MEWKDVGEFLKGNAGGVAGLVGSLMTGNIPGIVMAGASLVKSATGADTPEAAMEQLQTNPEAMLRLKELANANEASIRDHLFAMENARLADVADARKRDALFIASGKTNTRANFMIAMDALGLICCLVVLTMFREKMPGEVVGLLSTIAGGFLLCLRDAHQFEFGSSRGSREKDEALVKAAGK